MIERYSRMVPDEFARRQIELYGTDGAVWLERLPALIQECARRWSLQVQPPFPELSYNYVAPARCADGSDVVLKLGVPNLELTTEIAALRDYGGRGIVQLLDADAEWGVLLLERVRPGRMLAERTNGAEEDAQATRIAANVMRQLRRPAPPQHEYPTVNRWFLGLERLRQEFDGGVGPFPRRLVETAERLSAELLASMGEPVLLHGDLHHYNILSAEREPWLAIDPKGVVGEAEYEVGALMRNPLSEIWPHSNLRQMLARRVDILCDELGYDRGRVVGWSIAQAVLSAWWSYEGENEVSETFLTFAQLLAELE